jgi:hypothetical protein
VAHHDALGPGVSPPLSAARVAPRLPQGPVLGAVESNASVPATPTSTLPGGPRTFRTPRVPRPGAPASRLRVCPSPGRSALSARRSGRAGRDPPAPTTPDRAIMRHSTAVWSPHASLIGAAGSRPRGPLPPVCPPAGHPGRKPAFPAPGGPRIPPGARVLTPLPTSVDHRYAPHHRTHVLPKRLGLSENAIRAGAAVPFNQVFVSAARHKHSSSLGRASDSVGSAL